VPPQVERQDAPLTPTLLGKPLVETGISRHAVEADERLTPRVAPLV
jgi:hypothetical protein